MITSESTDEIITGLGERTLPNGWEWTRLGDVILSARNGFGRRPQGTEVGPIVLRLADVSTGVIDLRTPRRVDMSPAELENYQVKRGDLLFVRVNGSRDLVGRCIPVEADLGDVVYNDHLIRVRLDNRTDPEYVRYVCNADEARSHMIDRASTSAGQLTISQDVIASLRVPLPPLPEQRRIAAVLGEQLAAVERARAAAAAQLEAARSLPAAYLRAVFESEEARGWPRRRLGDVCEIAAGVTIGRKLENFTTRRVPYLRVANVRDGRLDLSSVYETEATEGEIRKHCLQYGDLLLTEGGDPDKLGRGTFWQEEIPVCIHQNHIFRVRFDLGQFSPAFMSAQAGSTYGKSYFLAHAKQTTGIATINRQVLSAFPLLAPPLPEQERIAAELAERMARAERAREALEGQVEAIGWMPGALLRRAFAGEM